MPRKRGTASKNRCRHQGGSSGANVSGAYLEFQTAVLKALPRDLDDQVALDWANNGEALQQGLAFLRPPQNRATGGPAQDSIAGEKQRDPAVRQEKLITALNAARIQIPALTRPTLAGLQAKWDWIQEIESDTSPTGPAILWLATVLQDQEEKIDGVEYERRLTTILDQLGYQQLAWLVANQDKHPAFRALLGLIYLDGPAIVVVDSYGRRGVACLYQSGGRWCLYWGWLSSDFRRVGRIAVSGK